MGVCVCVCMCSYLIHSSHLTHSEVKFCMDTKAFKTCFQLIQVTLFGLKSGPVQRKNLRMDDCRRIGMARWHYGNVLLARIFVQILKFAIAASIVNLNIRRKSHRSVLVVFNLLQGFGPQTLIRF